MIGYSPIYRGYKFLNSTGKTYIARHVKFNEYKFPYLDLFPSSKSYQSMFLVQQNHNSVLFFFYIIYSKQ